MSMKIFLPFLILVSTLSIACDDGFIKNKTIEILVNSLNRNDMTEINFKRIIKKFETFFNSHIDQEYYVELQVIGSWSSNTVNAYADQSEKAWLIRAWCVLTGAPKLHST